MGMNVTQEEDLIIVENNGCRVELIGESYEMAIGNLKKITDVSFGSFAVSTIARVDEYSLNHAFAVYTEAWAKRDELAEIGVDI